MEALPPRAEALLPHAEGLPPQMGAKSRNLLVVVRLTLDDGACPVNLLRKDEAHHLVREGHLREANLLICTFINRF